MSLWEALTVIVAYWEMIAEEYWVTFRFPKQPTNKLLCEFVNERLGIERSQEFFDCLLIELINQAISYGIILGKRVGHDVTDTNSFKFDKEAKYTCYYGYVGYKVDVVHDLDDTTSPLHYMPMHITDREGNHLIPTQQHLRKLGCKLEEEKVNGSYTSYKTSHAVNPTEHL